MSKFADRLAELNPEAILFEPREFYDAAIIDITNVPEDHWGRPSPSPWVAVYNYSALIDATLRCNGIEPSEAGEDDVDDAQEWVDFNTCGLWAGPGTPLIHTDEWDEFCGEDIDSEDADGT